MSMRVCVCVWQRRDCAANALCPGKRHFGRVKLRWWPSPKCSVAIWQIENTKLKMKTSWRQQKKRPSRRPGLCKWAAKLIYAKVSATPPLHSNSPPSMLHDLQYRSCTYVCGCAYATLRSLPSHARHLLVMGTSGCKMAPARGSNNVATNSLISNVPTKWTWATTKRTPDGRRQATPSPLPSIYGRHLCRTQVQADAVGGRTRHQPGGAFTCTCSCN